MRGGDVRGCRIFWRRVRCLERAVPSAARPNPCRSTSLPPLHSPPTPAPRPGISRGSSTKGGGRAKLEAAFGANEGRGRGLRRVSLYKPRGRKPAPNCSPLQPALRLASQRVLGDRHGEGPLLRAQSQPGHHGALLPSKSADPGHPLSLAVRRLMGARRLQPLFSSSHGPAPARNAGGRAG